EAVLTLTGEARETDLAGSAFKADLVVRGLDEFSITSAPAGRRRLAADGPSSRRPPGLRGRPPGGSAGLPPRPANDRDRQAAGHRTPDHLAVAHVGAVAWVGGVQGTRSSSAAALARDTPGANVRDPRRQGRAAEARRCRRRAPAP